VKNFYDFFAEKVSTPRLYFMNYGYADATTVDYGWVQRGDRRQKYHLNLVRRALQGIDLAGKSVLEIGSGRGGNCHYLARYTTARSIYGIDICEGNSRICQGRGTPRTVFLCADAARIPFADKTFDVVLNLESSHLYPEFDRFLAEVHRVLRPQGMFAYGDLWFFERIPMDWKKRENALRNSPFVIEAEEDATEGVFSALKKKDGVNSIIQSLKKPGNHRLMDRLMRENNAMRTSLALVECSYLIFRLRRP
jgi:O-methyltransferase